MEINAALDVFEALSQETRLATVRLLVRAGPRGCSAGDIAAELDCRQNTLSSHLGLLQRAGLVDRERQGRSIVYRVRFGRLRELILFLMEDCCAGNVDVCRPVAQSASRQIMRE
jgi:DNA-binding transcriptional ArsR family regulator